jgi:hypothetical protein
MLVPEDRELCFLTPGRIPSTGIGQSQGLYLYRTAQHRKTSTNFYALSEIRTQGNKSFLFVVVMIIPCFSGQEVDLLIITHAAQHVSVICTRRSKANSTRVVEVFYCFSH